MKRYLAFDLGAESGRALIGGFDGRVLSLDELHRFPNEPVRVRGALHWDILRLWHEMQRALELAEAQPLSGIAVDTWGVDYALLGEGGELLSNPLHYRDSRNDGVLERIFAQVPPDKIYAETGIQFMQINTLCQLVAARLHTPHLLEAAAHFVTIPDLLNYWLTGVIQCEYTNASTTQFLNPVTRNWAVNLLERLRLPTHILPPIVEPGAVLGTWTNGVPVIAPACHDTGSAVAAIPLTGTTAYISSGTWSLMGAEIAKPIVTEKARRLNFTNEGGVAGTTRLLKNIMGMWLLQSCRREWNNADYGALIALASPEARLTSLIDPDHPSFLHPPSMTAAIASFCKARGEQPPASEAGFVQTILESLALKYRYTLEALESLTGTRYTEVRVVGGGARNRRLNQFTADATGRRVVAGPVEATALGNIVMQVLATGEVSSLQDGRAAVDRSFPTEVFEPRDRAPWDAAYTRFLQFEGRP